MTAPFKLTGTPAHIKRHAPLMGEQTLYVFQELLGVPRQRVEEMVERKVLW